MRSKEIQLGHGSGGRLTAELMQRVFLPAYSNPLLAILNDQAVFSLDGGRLAFTTDTFVVKPLFFPGGDIGKLAVNGTVNDLAMGGARPRYLSASFVLEEGLPIDELKRVVASMAEAAGQAEVEIVTGDTKVVERGHGDGIYINTAGVGVVEHACCLSANQAQAGDTIIVSGPLGDHGMAVMARREGLEFDAPIESDTQPLHDLVATMLAAVDGLRCLRDPTRGGLATTLNEIAESSGVGMVLDERAIPVRPAVAGLCELLGLDPFYVPCEGRLVAIVRASDTDAVLEAMRAHPRGEQAIAIGQVVADHPSTVVMKTCVGGTRIVDVLSGEQLPRIC
ncbi:MAG: hydrogenase expression/formation protein HypE [Planctomycetales bacterium]|nr:hydrogenase expression/formation protein HypE [Planctomycetales bacterium]